MSRRSVGNTSGQLYFHLSECRQSSTAGTQSATRSKWGSPGESRTAPSSKPQKFRKRLSCKLFILLWLCRQHGVRCGSRGHCMEPIDRDGLHPRWCGSYTIPHAIGARIELDFMGRPCRPCRILRKRHSRDLSARSTPFDHVSALRLQTTPPDGLTVVRAFAAFECAVQCGHRPRLRIGALASVRHPHPAFV